MLQPALVKSMVLLLEALTAIVHSLNHQTQSLRYESGEATRNAAWRDVVKIVVLSE
jgi:hypothetical protein